MSVKVMKVYFTSVNFNTTLRWDAECEAQHPCTYSVKYKVYGDRDWTNKPDCRGTQNSCDMTAETLQKLHVEDMMLAKVKANAGNVTSPWMMSKPFIPIRDTNITGLAVSLSPSADAIVIDITAPPLLYFSMYPEKRKKALFNITVSNMSKLLWNNITVENVLKIKDLPPDHYCISVKMKFEEKTSDQSPKVCVNLNELAVKEVILGSAVAICVSIVIVVILAFYLIVNRQVLHPKAHLPSNLIFNDVKSKSSAGDYKSDETFLAASIFEGMEFWKHTQESLNNEEHPQTKRYVSTETWRKDYVNFRQKYTHPNVPLCKTVELRNSTYGTNTVDCLLEYPSIWISPDTRYTEAKECLHYGHICNDSDYYNNPTLCEEGFKMPYFNQEEKPYRFYINDQFQAYGNISGNA